MNDFSTVANRVEAGLWIAIAAALAVRAFSCDQRLRKVYWILAIAFLLFGVSDLIEAHTGAWWRPVWLLFWKGGCLVVIAGGLWVLWKAAKKLRDPGS